MNNQTQIALSYGLSDPTLPAAEREALLARLGADFKPGNCLTPERGDAAVAARQALGHPAYWRSWHSGERGVFAVDSETYRRINPDNPSELL